MFRTYSLCFTEKKKKGSHIFSDTRSGISITVGYQGSYVCIQFKPEFFSGAKINKW